MIDRARHAARRARRGYQWASVVLMAVLAAYAACQLILVALG